jgi:hypothetical protein
MITVVGFAWGSAYKDEVQGWWDSVQALDPPADDIVIAYHPDDDCGVKDLPCRLVECRTRTCHAMINAAVATIKQGWIANLGMDDRFYPDAFSCIPSNIDKVADVVANTLRFMSSGGVNPSAPELFASAPMRNHVMGTSWFTKDIWERTGGYPECLLVGLGVLVEVLGAWCKMVQACRCASVGERHSSEPHLIALKH